MKKNSTCSCNDISLFKKDTSKTKQTSFCRQVDEEFVSNETEKYQRKDIFKEKADKPSIENSEMTKYLKEEVDRISSEKPRRRKQAKPVKYIPPRLVNSAYNYK